jgi:hypothetical protein
VGEEEEEEENYVIKRLDSEMQHVDAWKEAWERGNSNTRSR